MIILGNIDNTINKSKLESFSSNKNSQKNVVSTKDNNILTTEIKQLNLNIYKTPKNKKFDSNFMVKQKNNNEYESIRDKNCDIIINEYKASLDRILEKKILNEREDERKRIFRLKKCINIDEKNEIKILNAEERAKATEEIFELNTYMFILMI